MGNWSGLDFFIFLIFVLNTVLGMSRGATKEIISMICLNVALIFAIKFTVPLAGFFNSSPLIQNVLDTKLVQNFMAAIGAGSLTAGMLGEITYCLSVLVCFVGVFCTCEAVLAVTGASELFTFAYATWNRKIGGGMGFVRGYILAVILILIIQHLSIPTSNSYFVNLFHGTAQKLDSLIGGQQVERYKEIYEDKNLYSPEEMQRAVTTSPPPSSSIP